MVTRTVYTAYDGREFDNEDVCLKYERDLGDYDIINTITRVTEVDIPGIGVVVVYAIPNGNVINCKIIRSFISKTYNIPMSRPDILDGYDHESGFVSANEGMPPMYADGFVVDYDSSGDNITCDVYTMEALTQYHHSSSSMFKFIKQTLGVR